MAFIPLTANWETGIKENLEFSTTIATVANGHETSRRAMRQNPRRTIEFRAILHGSVRRRLIDRIGREQRAESRIPDFSAQQSRLATTATAGSTTIEIEGFLPGWAAVGSYLAIIEGDRAVEGRISTMSGSTITLTASLAETFTLRAIILPCITGHLSARLQADRFTDDLSEMAVSFSVLPGSEILDAGGQEGSAFGVETFTRKPSWTSELQDTIVAESIDIDYGRGRMARFTPITFPGRIMQFDYPCESRAKVNALKGLFLRAKGRRGSFLVPTWTRDVILRANSAAGSGILFIEGYEHDIDEVYQVLAIERTDGTITFVRVLSIARTLSGTSLYIADQTTRNYNPTEMVRISWVPLCRFATDSLVVNWITDEVADIRFSFQTLPYDDETSDLDEGAAWLVANYSYPFVKTTIHDPLQVIVNTTYPNIVEYV